MSTPTDTEPMPPEAPVDVRAVEVEQPSSTAVAQRPAGSFDLTFHADQDRLNRQQIAALRSVLSFDPQAPAHQDAVAAFLHLCVARHLDPFAKEAYLIKRGDGDNAKFTMQVGIDGFRGMAADTGRMIRVKETVWTGTDDDERSWWFDKDEGVMRRIWFDQWPDSRGNPGSARVTILHYDDAGNVVPTTVIADWRMYAPEVPAWEWGEQRGQKVYLRNPDGSQKMTLNEMWEKGKAHMLAKCAEALAYRKAFPRKLSGVYVHEEMHRADQAERERQQQTLRVERQRKYLEATGQAPKVATPVVAPAPQPARQETPEPEGAAPAGPLLDLGTAQDVHDAEVVPDDAPPAQPAVQPAEDVQDAETEDDQPPADDPAPEAPAAPEPVDAETLEMWLRDEMKWMAEVTGQEMAATFRRFIGPNRRNPEQFTIDQCREAIAAMRPLVVMVLRRDGEDEVADAYERLRPDEYGPVERLTGLE